MAIDINIPSQVKNYANLAGFPATGTLKTIFIAEDTNKTYRWTGSAYVEISATAASTWGAITGTLSNQTDLQNALNAKQDTLVSATNIKTINGTTLLGSGDLVVGGGGVTIGTTAITSGTVGRVLFEGTGNVVQESANLFWDNTNGRLGIGTSAPNRSLHVVGQSTFNNLIFNDTSAITVHTNIELKSDNAYETGLLLRSTTGLRWQIYVNNYTSNNFIFYNYKLGAQAMMIAGGTNNLLINTTTDAGFKLDVNGTARVSGNFNIATGFELNFNNQNVGLYRSANNLRLGGFGGIEFLSSETTIASQTIRMTLFNTGNFAINTTTDAGFKLDVNGTARVQSSLSWGNSRGTLTFTSTDAYMDASQSGGSLIYRTNGNTEVARFTSTQNILIGTTTDVVSSLVTMNSTTKGFLPPRMTTTQKNAIATPATGLILYDTTLNVPQFYNGTIWVSL